VRPAVDRRYLGEPRGCGNAQTQGDVEESRPARCVGSRKLPRTGSIRRSSETRIGSGDSAHKYARISSRRIALKQPTIQADVRNRSDGGGLTRGEGFMDDVRSRKVRAFEKRMIGRIRSVHKAISTR